MPALFNNSHSGSTPMSINEPIDIVYTWVDGKNPVFRQEQCHCLAEHPGRPSEITSPKLFHDNQELRFSLRSMETFAPWVRKVFLVTNGQPPPSWIRKDHPKLNLVTHRDIFPDPDCLPTFNSNAIELNLHRIKGLSRRFLYFNDDVFLGRPITPRDFLTSSGGQVFHVDDIPLHQDPERGPVHDRAYAYTLKIACTYGSCDRNTRLPSHSPQLYDRRLLDRLENRFRIHFDEGRSHRLRHPRDLVIRLLYVAQLLESEEPISRHQIRELPWHSKDYRFIMLKSGVLPIRDLIALRTEMPKFFCINNDLNGTLVDRITLKLVRYTLQRMFPRPSTFEAKPATRYPALA